MTRLRANNSSSLPLFALLVSAAKKKKKVYLAYTQHPDLTEQTKQGHIPLVLLTWTPPGTSLKGLTLYFVVNCLQARFLDVIRAIIPIFYITIYVFNSSINRISSCYIISLTLIIFGNLEPSLVSIWNNIFSFYSLFT